MLFAVDLGTVAALVTIGTGLAAAVVFIARAVNRRTVENRQRREDDTEFRKAIVGYVDPLGRKVPGVIEMTAALAENVRQHEADKAIHREEP